MNEAREQLIAIIETAWQQWCQVDNNDMRNIGESVLDALVADRDILLEAIGGQNTGFTPSFLTWRFPVASPEESF